MPFTPINGIKIHYEVNGSGPPLLMLAPGGIQEGDCGDPQQLGAQHSCRAGL